MKISVFCSKTKLTVKTVTHLSRELYGYMIGRGLHSMRSITHILITVMLPRHVRLLYNKHQVQVELPIVNESMLYFFEEIPEIGESKTKIDLMYEHRYKNGKTMLFLYQILFYNCSSLLKWPVCVASPQGKFRFNIFHLRIV